MQFEEKLIQSVSNCPTSTAYTEVTTVNISNKRQRIKSLHDDLKSPEATFKSLVCSLTEADLHSAVSAETRFIHS